MIILLLCTFCFILPCTHIYGVTSKQITDVKNRIASIETNITSLQESMPEIKETKELKQTNIDIKNLKAHKEKAKADIPPITEVIKLKTEENKISEKITSIEKVLKKMSDHKSDDKKYMGDAIEELAKIFTVLADYNTILTQKGFLYDENGVLIAKIALAYPPEILKVLSINDLNKIKDHIERKQNNTKTPQQQRPYLDKRKTILGEIIKEKRAVAPGTKMKRKNRPPNKIIKK